MKDYVRICTGYTDSYGKLYSIFNSLFCLRKPPNVLKILLFYGLLCTTNVLLTSSKRVYIFTAFVTIICHVAQMYVILF